MQSDDGAVEAAVADGDVGAAVVAVAAAAAVAVGAGGDGAGVAAGAGAAVGEQPVQPQLGLAEQPVPLSWPDLELGTGCT